MYLAVYAAALVPYMVIPFGPVSNLYYGALAWSGVLMMIGRLLVARPPHATALWLLTGCEASTAAGVVLIFLLGQAEGGPHVIAFVLGNLAGIVGMVLLVRRQMRGRNRENLLDALVVTGGFALLCWVYLVEPAREAAGSLSAGLIAISYPLMDLFVLALLIRLLLEGGLRNRAMRLIAAAQFTFLVADVGFAFVPPGLGQSPLVFQVITAVALGVFGLFGAAALHPDFTSLTVDRADARAAARAAARAERPWLRTALLCAAVLTGPALLLAQAWQNDSRVPDAVAIAVGCAVIFALVVVRLQTLVGRVAAQSVTLARQADRLRVLASQDGLTGLANRRAWDGLLPDGLQRAGRDGHAVTIAMIDLDHFKRYNDDHGHQAGDRLLKSVAAAWAVQLREVDMLARYGGEEFIALLPGCPAAEAASVVQRLREATPEGQTFSAGIAEWDRQETCDQLVARADAALYEAKNAGRDRFVVARAVTNSAAWTALRTHS
ncbi:MAG TPA: GGDEF domain-containing protein [Micromonosporaceae bacterium]|nr:GGDEF domain-containing protein [Micromonosporaceae bacterium]